MFALYFQAVPVDNAVTDRNGGKTNVFPLPLLHLNELPYDRRR